MPKDLQVALDHLVKGEWEAAHVIVQEDDSALASWMHAVVHLQEGDTSNANYWFKRAGQPMVGIAEIDHELKKIGAQIANSE